MKSRHLLCLLAFASLAGAGPAQQSDASYESAIRNQSTSPSYVMITVVETKTGVVRPTCTGANFLLGAIVIEDGLSYDRDGATRAMQIALRNRNHTFKFSKQEALRNVERHYTDEELANIRRALQGRSVSEVLQAVNSDRTLTELVHGRTFWERYWGLQEAAACVLIERGESPVLADITGQLFVTH